MYFVYKIFIIFLFLLFVFFGLLFNNVIFFNRCDKLLDVEYFLNFIMLRNLLKFGIFKNSFCMSFKILSVWIIEKMGYNFKMLFIVNRWW